MTIRAGIAVALGLAMLTCACSPSDLPASAPILPLRTLRLYETGVGYFERSGTLRSADVTVLPVPAGHLDDALKTLVVLGPQGGSSVSGIEFGSSISRGMARALAGLPVEGEQPLDLQQLLAGLKGASLEVHTHTAPHKGRLIDVVEADDDGRAIEEAQGGQPDGDSKAPRRRFLTLLLLEESGSIVRIVAKDIDFVRPLDRSYGARLGSALETLSSSGARSERMIHVLAQGGPLTLGYVTEAPVWRATYRLVLDGSAPSGVLQGWALVHNDTDEDWRGVHVELANGRPDSFLFPLAAPRYARRPLVTPEDDLATVPQLMGTTVDAIWGDRIGDSYGSGGLGESGTGEGGGGRGEGIGLGAIGGAHGRAGGPSSLLAVGNLAQLAPAPGVEAGALFVYRMPQPLDLHAHGSALVPFAQQRVDAQSISWFDSAEAPARAAVRFVNTTPQTLPAGTIAFFSEGGFAGESALARLKPGERSFVTYGQDLDVEIHTIGTHSTEETRRLVWNASTNQLEQHYLRTSDFTYAIENRSGTGRHVVLGLTVDKNASLSGADVVDFDVATSRPLAVFKLEPRKRVERKLHAVEGLERSMPLSALTAARLNDLAASPALLASDRPAAAEAASGLRVREQDLASIEQTRATVAEVEKDLQRLREHMKAFAGGERPQGAGPNPFAARVLAAEDSLVALRRKLDALDADAKAKSEAARLALARLVP